MGFYCWYGITIPFFFLAVFTVWLFKIMTGKRKYHKKTVLFTCFALLTKKSDSGFKCLILKIKYKIKYTFYNNLILYLIILTPIAINDDKCNNYNLIVYDVYHILENRIRVLSTVTIQRVFAKNIVFYTLKNSFIYKKCWTNHINKIEEHTAIAIISTAVHTGTIQCIVLT